MATPRLPARESGLHGSTRYARARHLVIAGQCSGHLLAHWRSVGSGPREVVDMPGCVGQGPAGQDARLAGAVFDENDLFVDVRIRAGV
jgi:hypothetical protein